MRVISRTGIISVIFVISEDKFIHMIKVAFSSIQSTIKINVLLSDPSSLMQGIRVYSKCYYALLSFRYLPISLITIKGIQIGDHVIKLKNFADDTTIFLRDITYLNRIQVILKLYEVASSSKINFPKARPCGFEHIKKELISQGKWNSRNFPLKHLEQILVNLPLTTAIRTK